MNKKFLLLLIPLTTLVLSGCGKRSPGGSTSGDDPTTAQPTSGATTGSPTGGTTGGSSGTTGTTGGSSTTGSSSSSSSGTTSGSSSSSTSVDPGHYVPVHAGTEADPFDAVDAYNVAAELESCKSPSNKAEMDTDQQYFVRGVVTEFVEAWSSGYGNYHFKIGDSQTPFIGYRLLNGPTKAKFPLGTELEVGDTVTMYATLIHWYDDMETNDGYIHSIQKKPGTVSGVAVSSQGDVASIEVNTQLQFNAAVSGTGSFDDSVTWSVEPLSAGSISPTGLFTAGASAAADVVIRATSVADNNVSGTKTIQITPEAAVPGVTSVTVSPSEKACQVGDADFSLMANVIVTGGAATTVTWSVTSGAAVTVNSSTGLVHIVGPGEAVVTATSTVDTGKFGSCTITVTDPSVIPTGRVTDDNWVEQLGPVVGTDLIFGCYDDDSDSKAFRFLNGTITNYYPMTTTDTAGALRFTVAQVGDKYTARVTSSGALNGKYLAIIVDGTHVNGVYQDSPCEFDYFEEITSIGKAKAYNNKDYCFAERNGSYESLGPTANDYWGSNFIGRFYKYEEPAAVDSFTIKTCLTSYLVGDHIDPSSLVITVTYEGGGDPEDVPYVGNEGKFSFVPALTKELETTDELLTVTFGGKNKSTAISVTVDTLLSIAISGDMTKKSYSAGDDWDPAGLVATGHYNSSPAKVLTDVVWAYSPATATAGTTSVNVTASKAGVTSAAFTVNGITVSEVPSSCDIEFKAAGSDGSTAFDTSNVKGEVSSGASYIASVTTATKLFPGTSGLKFGSGSAQGILEFNTSSDVRAANVASIVIGSAKYGSDTGTLDIYLNGSSTKAGSITPANGGTITVSPATVINSIKIQTSAKRAYLVSISFVFA